MRHLERLQNYILRALPNQIIRREDRNTMSEEKKIFKQRVQSLLTILLITAMRASRPVMKLSIWSRSWRKRSPSPSGQCIRAQRCLAGSVLLGTIFRDGVESQRSPRICAMRFTQNTAPSSCWRCQSTIRKRGYKYPSRVRLVGARQHSLSFDLARRRRSF